MKKAEISTRAFQQQDAEELSMVSQKASSVQASNGVLPRRRRNRKPSPSESWIISVLKNKENGKSHQNVDEIYRNLMKSRKKVSYATIYRVLLRMEEKGLVTRHQFTAGGSTYELATPDRHHHFIDVESSKVFDFNNEEIERLLLDIADHHDMELVDYKVVLFIRQ